MEGRLLLRRLDAAWPSAASRSRGARRRARSPAPPRPSRRSSRRRRAPASGSAACRRPGSGARRSGRVPCCGPRLHLSASVALRWRSMPIHDLEGRAAAGSPPAERAGGSAAARRRRRAMASWSAVGLGAADHGPGPVGGSGRREPLRIEAQPRPLPVAEPDRPELVRLGVDGGAAHSQEPRHRRCVHELSWLPRLHCLVCEQLGEPLRQLLRCQPRSSCIAIPIYADQLRRQTVHLDQLLGAGALDREADRSKSSLASRGSGPRRGDPRRSPSAIPA